jgi:serine/threonine protein kinase
MNKAQSPESENPRDDAESSPTPESVSATAECAEPSSPDLSGTTMNGYQLVRKVAEGGMGVVYEAQQLNLSRKVAIKVLSEQLASRKEFVQRFQREARAAAALNHPHMVQVHDFGETEGFCYLVMEFVEGQNLSDYIDDHGKMTVPDALEIIEQSAHALKAAHQQGIVHRDVKPSNLMLTPDGRVKISDLGLSKNLAEASDLTLSGIGMGSPYFMAPEQASDAKGVDHRADIYALGLTLLFLLTGKRPFDGNTPYSIILSHANKPLPQGKDLGTDLPAEVDAVIQRMAAKDPDNRYPDYDALIEDLQRAKEGFAPALKPIRLSLFQRRLAFGTAVGLLTLLIVGVYRHFATLHSYRIAQVAAKSIETPAPREVRSPEPERKARGTFEPEDAGPPGPEREGDFPLDGPNRRGRFLLPMGPMPRPSQNQLREGTVDAMLSEARGFAITEPENFRGQVDRYRQVLARAESTPQEKTAHEELNQVIEKHQKVLRAAIQSFERKMKDKLRGGTPQEAYNVWKDFPNTLRTRESDQQIQSLLEENLPRDFQPR